MKERTIRLLERLTEAHGVSGFEGEVREIFVEELRGVGEMRTDGLGGVFCELGEASPRVLLVGHMDEIGFLVQNITPDGFLQMVAVGGWWEHQLLAQRVEVKNVRGERILGVVVSKPVHFLPEAQRRQVMGMESLLVDVGASSRVEVEEEMGIFVGAPIAPYSSFGAFGAGDDLLIAKAFDNRAGMAGVIEAGLHLHAIGHPNRLILGGTVQEEVGLRGAKVAANLVKPDVVIVLEGPPADDTPGFSRVESQGRLGGGVQIRLFDPTAIASPRLGQLAIDTAREMGIVHQVTVRRSGGTDAGSFHLAGEGIPTLVLGVPTRYIHSHNSVLDLRDYRSMVELATALVRRLDEDVVGELTSFL